MEEFVDDLSPDTRAGFVNAVTRLAMGEALPMPLNRNFSSVCRGLRELRFNDRTGHYRFFYYMKVRDAIYFVHAIEKKSQTLPREELETLLRRTREI